MKIVVTGGAGFIGANLCAHLGSAQVGHEIVALDDLSTGFRENLQDVEAHFVEGSILDERLLAETFSGADAVVHLAARPSVPRSVADPVATHRVNVDGTLRVLEACRAMPKAPMLVFASSSSVYGANPVLPKVETLAPMPRSPYAASKLAAEAYVLSWGLTYGIDTLAFRFFNVFGPLQRPDHAYAAVVPVFLAAALRGEPLPIHGNGTQTRDFTYVGTVVDVIARAVTERVSSATPVNLAFGTRTSLSAMIGELEQVVGHSLDRSYLPLRHGDIAHSQADNTKLLQMFPEIHPVELFGGLVKSVAWMKRHL
jgi:UDP-glucose 4-epimerase